MGDTYLTKQLKQVARLIATRDDRKADRDFFFVTLNGFDLHSDASEGLEELFKDVDDSLKAFVTEVKAQGVWDSVVLASESDFGRSLQSNGAGTDHAWAGNHMILGGKVKGGSLLSSRILQNSMRHTSFPRRLYLTRKVHAVLPH